VPLIEAAYPGTAIDPALAAPERERARSWTRDDALRELVRGRLEIVGPVTEAVLARALGLDAGGVELALLALEREGFCCAAGSRRVRPSSSGVNAGCWRASTATRSTACAARSSPSPPPS
jgi:hypothetical protein